MISFCSSRSDHLAGALYVANRFICHPRIKLILQRQNAKVYIIVNLVSTPHTLNRSRPSRSQALGYSLIQVAKLDITPGFSSAKPLAALPTIFYKNLVRYRFFQIVVDQTLASASLVMDFHSQSFCDVGKTCPLEETSILNVLLSSEASSSAIKVCEPSYQGV